MIVTGANRRTFIRGQLATGRAQLAAHHHRYLLHGIRLKQRRETRHSLRILKATHGRL